MRLMMVATLVGIGLGGAATAQDRTGYHAIAAGDLARAEARLDRERRIFPERPELMLNLAAVYRQTGRDAAARALYADVLGQPAVMMDMPDGSIRSSHALATIGLTRLSAIASAR